MSRYRCGACVEPIFRDGKRTGQPYCSAGRRMNKVGTSRLIEGEALLNGRS